jgi:nitrogen fixation protein NifU and related proteins
VSSNIDLDDLYKEIILEHSQHPSHREPLSDANHHESGVNRSCGDEIELHLKIEDGVIKGISMEGRGCSISTASSSLMGQAVEGMEISRALELISQFKEMIVENKEVNFPEDAEELKALAGVQKYPIRVKCATLAWNTLEQALKNSK